MLATKHIAYIVCILQFLYTLNLSRPWIVLLIKKSFSFVHFHPTYYKWMLGYLGWLLARPCSKLVVVGPCSQTSLKWVFSISEPFPMTQSHLGPDGIHLHPQECVACFQPYPRISHACTLPINNLLKKKKKEIRQSMRKDDKIH